MSLHVIAGAGASATATARLLAEAGEQVRVITRSGGGPDHPGIERIAADVNDGARIGELADGAATVFNCLMPLYYRWPTDFPPLNTSLLTAAEGAGADYVILGNAYGYGPVDGPVTEDLPMSPTTVKGRVRAEMWQEALAAWDAGRVRVTEVRASDFIGPGAASVFTLLVAPRIAAGEPVVVPADLDVPHTWTYTGDVARTLIAAADDDRSWGRAWHVPSNPPLSIRDLATGFAEALGAPAPQLRAMSQAELDAAATADPVMAELPEMQYLLQRPFVFDSGETQRMLRLTPTPLDDVLRRSAAAPAVSA